MKKLISELFDKYKIPYTLDMLDKLDKYYNLVIEWNEKINLTAITEKNDFAIKHFLDCCLPYTLLPQGAKCIDIGAGAGFPSIPLKIIRPDLKITMVDSLNKRVNFLNLVISELGLKEINAVHSRAEDFACIAGNREGFDIAITRAVAQFVIILEYCLPFVKVGGKFIAMKGANFDQELSVSDLALNTLKGKVINKQEIYVEEIDSQRVNVVVEKVGETPKKFPRGKNQPRNNPLI